jgi:glutamine amidotransferase-like uncharacterized protein
MQKEIVTKRKLALSKATARGPVTPYDGTRKGERSIPIELASGMKGTGDIDMFVNGGPYFTYDREEDQIREETLGWYRMKNGVRLPAIIHSRFGKGNAILSGLHFEFDVSEIPGRVVRLREDSLERNNQARSDLIDVILKEKLGLSVGPSRHGKTSSRAI